MKKVLDHLLKVAIKPVKSEPIFFVMMLVLILPRTLLFWVTHLDSWLVDWFEFPTLRYVGIAVVYAYIATILVVGTRSKFLKLLFYIVTYSLFFVNIFLAANFHATISASTLLLAYETTCDETSDFISTFGLTTRSYLVYVIVLAIALVNIYYENIKKRLLLNITPLISQCFKVMLVLFLIGGLYSLSVYNRLFSGRSIEEVEQNHLNELPHMDFLTGAFAAYYTLNKASEVMEEAVNRTIAIKGDKYTLIEPNDSCDLILVLGESFAKRHSSLYGYYLPTNERLKRELDAGRVITFTDVITPSILTSTSLRNVFSCNSVGDGEKWYEYPIFPAIFKSAGYHVYFWDNQYNPVSNAGADFSLNAFIHNPKISSVSYNKTQGMISNFDGDLVNDFESYMKSNKMGSKNLVIFHLQGQHFAPENHYPPKSVFNHFTINDIKREDGWMNEKKKQEIADYDNCTFYNDSVIYHIISIFKTKPSVMVYLSDHGENIYDVDNSIGRRFDLTEKDADMVKCLHEVPLFVWYSDSYKSNNEMIIGDLNEAKDKPMMTDNVCHLLMRLGGVNSSCYNSSRDISTDDYKCPPRIVGNHVNFDKLY